MWISKEKLILHEKHIESLNKRIKSQEKKIDELEKQLEKQTLHFKGAIPEGCFLGIYSEEKKDVIRIYDSTGDQIFISGGEYLTQWNPSIIVESK